ncbi:hypothetical protein HS125_17120 [bacterium]|nr:hypothetical protein [bacterium]
MSYAIDLIVLTADGQIEAALKGILCRCDSLRIAKPRCGFYRHPSHDSGCLREAHLFLAAQSRRAGHALIVFDRRGCGREELARVELEQMVERNLAETGWRDRSAVVVLDPELEIWVWSDSPEVEACLGWDPPTGNLRRQLQAQGLWDPDGPKPSQPKEALLWALRQVDKRPSAAIFEDLAQRVSFRRCSDPAFQKLCAVLRNWFPDSGTASSTTKGVCP